MKKVDSKAGHYCKLLNLIYSTWLFIYIYLFVLSQHTMIGACVCKSFARLVIKRLINVGECGGLMRPAWFKQEWGNTVYLVLHLFERI